jgi:protein SCO1
MSISTINLKSILSLAAFVIIVSACNSNSESKLPIMGRTEYKEVDGKLDTIYHTIPNYSFVDQDSVEVTPNTFSDKIYVADFFFGTCPTICPIMKRQMIRVYDEFKDNPEFALLSHTIDPDHDTVAYLKDYSEKIGVMDNQVWHFVTGDKDKIYETGQEGYMVATSEDPVEVGGFIHSGAFILVDKEKRIRGFYDGTKKDQVDRLINDIPKLLAEYK